MMCVLPMCGVRGAVSCVRRVRTGVSVTGVARVSTVRPMTAMRTMTTVRTMTAVSDVPELGEPSHRHRGEPGAAESEAEAIEVHIPNTTCRRAGW